MAGRCDFNLIFAIMMGAILSVFGNIIVHYLFNWPDELFHFGMLGIALIMFLGILIYFLVLSWRYYLKNK